MRASAGAANVGSAGPDLLVVGGQRCATTWLANVLRKHPEVWISPVKEIHYFDQQRPGSDPGAFRRRYLGHLRKRFRQNLRRVVRLEAPCWWDFRYFLVPRSDDWYCSLFRSAQRKGRLAGEATPAYALLSEEVYRTLAEWNPNLRVIMVMREPVSRSWSAVKNWSRKNRAGQATREELIECAQWPENLARSEYWNTIERLERVFDRNRIFYGFYDDLADDPVGFVDSVLRFLNVDNLKAAAITESEQSERKPPKSDVPTEFRSKMEPYFLDGVASLCSRFGGAPCRWQEEYAVRLGSNE